MGARHEMTTNATTRVERVSDLLHKAKYGEASDAVSDALLHDLASKICLLFADDMHDLDSLRFIRNLVLLDAAYVRKGRDEHQ